MPTENLCTPSLDSCSNQATTTLHMHRFPHKHLLFYEKRYYYCFSKKSPRRKLDHNETKFLTSASYLFQIADSEIQAGVAPQPYPEPDHEVTKQVYIYYFFNERHK
jgi:hypothetical protein